MTRICPKCNYARQASDIAPEWQCPSCQVAYRKVGSASASTSDARHRASPAHVESPGFPSSIKWIFLAAAIGVGIWIAKPFETAEPIVRAPADSSSQPTVILYGTEWCGYCDAARSFLTKNGIRYDDVDVEKTTAGYEEHKRLGGNGVPLFVIGDEVVHGYSEQSMRRTLQPWLNGS